MKYNLTLSYQGISISFTNIKIKNNRLIVYYDDHILLILDREDFKIKYITSFYLDLSGGHTKCIVYRLIKL